MTDVSAAMQSTASLYSDANGSMPPLGPKQALLRALLDNEQMNLHVWLFPLDHEKRHFLPLSPSNKGPSDVRIPTRKGVLDLTVTNQALLSQILRVAWQEDPRIAIRMTSRFPSSKLSADCRALMLRHPKALLGEPDALPVFVGPAMPPDVALQRRVSDSVCKL